MFPYAPIESNVVAVLGPTNTGKTHRAIERMLEHRSGMMGFPLRLLAREVYDRVCAKVGEQKVALLTGEERKIPKHARYWLCTVEAMPQELELEFVAIDEIQLAADRERGHVFTQRLLKARGSLETWFLGSLSMERVIRSLIPHVRVDRLNRLSTLRFGGRVSLSGLPARTAVVALSRRELYPIAEHIRQRKGGVALVLGALSPNARNAQVDLFQSGKVDYLVATDAIGMGLNLDLQHVVFASLNKFDGQRRRALSMEELGQIAGRAGRHVQDGTFYTLNNGPQLDAGTVRAIEEHRVHSKTRLVWRNDELDFSSAEALIESLRLAPPGKVFQKLQKADDFEALLWLYKRPAIRHHLHSSQAVRLLWTVCQIPDYRKLMLDRHFLLLEEIFVQLCQEGGQLSPAWLERKLKDADCTQGGIEVLMTRLAFIRTWSYVTHRPGWLEKPRIWQCAAREIEEKLSAALHEALTLRFLERKGAGNLAPEARPGAQAKPRPRKRAQPKASPVDQDHPFSVLSTHLLRLPEDSDPSEPEHWLEQWLAGQDAPLRLDGDLAIYWEGHPVACMGRGSSLLRPELSLINGVDQQVNAPERAELMRRLHAFVAAQLNQSLLSPSVVQAKPARLSDAGRALAYALRVNGGVSPWSELSSIWRRGCEHELEGVTEGWLYVYCKDSLSESAQAMRDKLAEIAASGGGQQAPDMPDWVFGHHDFEQVQVLIADLEQALAQRLGVAKTIVDGARVQEPAPILGISKPAWQRLLGGLGWKRGAQQTLVYQASRDRCRAGRHRARRLRVSSPR